MVEIFGGIDVKVEGRGIGAAHPLMIMNGGLSRSITFWIGNVSGQTSELELQNREDLKRELSYRVDDDVLAGNSESIRLPIKTIWLNIF